MRTFESSNPLENCPKHKIHCVTLLENQSVGQIPPPAYHRIKLGYTHRQLNTGDGLVGKSTRIIDQNQNKERRVKESLLQLTSSRVSRETLLLLRPLSEKSQQNIFTYQFAFFFFTLPTIRLLFLLVLLAPHSFSVCVYSCAHVNFMGGQGG